MFRKVDPKFPSSLQGAICFCEWEGKILMLKRSPHCSQGGFWTAAPGGKLDPGETPLEAVVREVFEETQLSLDPSKIIYKGSYLCRFSDLEYLLHIYYSRLASAPDIAIDPKEHTELRWATLEEAHQMPLMRGGTECLKAIFPEREP